MAGKSKKVEKIKLLSTGLTQAGKRTGTFKTTTKNKTNTPGKLKKRFYDKRAHNKETGKNGMHVDFDETKIGK